MGTWQKRRFMIWGKTAPELSSKYFEAVCTGAVLEDGTPIRLYPIPFRYLDEGDRFKKYQWITALIKKSTFDHRPESYKIDFDSIEPGNVVKTDTMEWWERRQIAFKDATWQFTSMDELTLAQATNKRSLGVVTPKQILSVDIYPRSIEEEEAFRLKKLEVEKKWKVESEGRFEEFMPPDLKGLEFIKNRIQVKWLCGAEKVHNMQILDWEVVEFQRKFSPDRALEAVKEHLDLSKYAIRFFMGNIKQHPTRFTIVGLWYPKRRVGVLPFE